MTEHPAIDKWGMNKYAQLDLPEGTKFRVDREERRDGYCETCYYDYEVVVVYIKQPAGEWVKLDELSTDLAEIMREVLDATMDTDS